MQFISLSFIIKRIKTIIYMMKDKSVPKRKKALIIVGIVYLLLPFDLIPPIIPILGFLDDFILWVFILGHLRDELNKYWVGDDEIKPTTKKYRGKNVINDVDFEVCEDETCTSEESNKDCKEDCRK
ncbi:YkvA family protein [Sinanaerobacter sp. ZZT-01]|uniref:YkvA family protein n=1 Tax=Sinanaerobacter sp. ZZT-01 TaxID=3111540 RepID=UPI002D786D5F|nr:DUF1232 domain-containing protein [Sinanaerobacter sp. ZZT-01]WRR92185.1 DUF1232 domain-containing protein [Sinanaerobacter sp. ZZT-01]